MNDTTLLGSFYKAIKTELFETISAIPSDLSNDSPRMEDLLSLKISQKNGLLATIINNNKTEGGTVIFSGPKLDIGSVKGDRRFNILY